MTGDATSPRRGAGDGSPATRLRRLAGRVRRLGDIFRGDPERPRREREAIEGELLRLAAEIDGGGA
ncbi:hypothetical protein [Dongia sp.]|uniref:hypothetical protein n=1 Tax=Dongia sp. TaxID=1977262 RepID=UPI003753B3EA